MKVLFAIPHYYKPVGTAPDGREHGSIRRDPQPRIAALTACLTAIRQTCTPKVCVLSHADRQARLLIPPEPIHAEVVICTVGGDHLLDSLPTAVRGWTHHPTAADPLLLGYECHAVLRDRQGKYDFYCYLEDDILLTDRGMFHKLVWFNQLFGDARLLQPNRFETGDHPLVDKMYVDGDLPARCTAIQKAANPTHLSAGVLGRAVTFRTTTNPHSGCFFLSTAQMERWARADYFLDRSTAFIGALESAATLGVMRTFEVFKPGPENADFFEVRHHGSAYLAMVSTGRESPPAG